MPTTPPTISAAPAAPQRGVKATFSARVDAFVTWLVAAVGQFAALATNVYNNAVETFNNATTASTAASTATSAAAAAVATANATLWVSGQSVAQDANKISPLDRQTYRRKTASGAGTTDPALDTTNYVPLLPLTRSFTSAEQLVTSSGNLTIAHGLGAIPKYLLPSVRDASSGAVFYPGPALDTAGGSTVGCVLSADSTNIYVYCGTASSAFYGMTNANARLTVRAYV